MLLFGPAAAAEEDPQTRAVELFQASQSSYEAGRFAEAAVYLEEAYRLDPNPILLYNLARARESEGSLSLALEAYQRYLREAPDAADRPAVEARVEALDRVIEERSALEAQLDAERQARAAAARAAEEARAAVAVRPPPGPNLAPWVLAGSGALGVAVGGVLGALAAGTHADAEGAPEQVRAADLASQADGLALGANLAYAVGGALVVGGLIWAVLEGGSEPTASLGVGPGGWALSGRF